MMDCKITFIHTIRVLKPRMMFISMKLSFNCSRFEWTPQTSALSNTLAHQNCFYCMLCSACHMQ